jgi:carbon-monoxide dehydrogenase medium subunit
VLFRSIALGGVTIPTMRQKRAEEVVKGKAITDSLIKSAAQLASEDGKIGMDIYFSAEYKKELLKVMLKRAMKQALKA